MVNRTGEAGEPAPDEGAHGPGMAIVDTIGELVGIFTHDLSNPLQSLTVLLELTLDDLPAGTDEHTRLEQSLEATERMRQMIRDFAGLARSGHAQAAVMTCGSAMDRALGLLARRFDRHQIKHKTALGDLANLPVPARNFEIGLLSLLLGAVASGGGSEFANFELSVFGSLPAKLGGDVARIEFGMAGHRYADQTLATMRLGATQVRRARQVLQGSNVTVLEHPNDSIRVEFPVTRESR